MQIKTLGGFSIISERERINLSKIRSRKARDLLKYLVAFRHKPIHIEILCDLFWRDMDQKYARINLQSTIYMLRSIVGKDKIVFHDNTYCFDPKNEIVVDADEFEKFIQMALNSKDLSERKTMLEKALDLYKGDFMAENLYEDWTLQFREHYRDLFVKGLLELGKIYLEEGHPHNVIELSKSALIQDPLNEEAVLLLMKAYIKNNNLSDAVKVYKEFSAILEKELQIKPSKELTQLYGQIVSGNLDNKWLIVVEGTDSLINKNDLLNDLKKAVRDTDEIVFLCENKVGIFLKGIPKAAAKNIYGRITNILDKCSVQTRISFREAR